MSATLNGLSEIRSHFFRDNTPTWSICASPYTLLGMDEWVRGFRYISYADCFDGQHPRVFSPERADRDVFPFETLEEMNTALLRNPAVHAQLKARGPGRAALQLFDEDAEELCRQLDLQLVFPRAELRRRIDDKIEATRLANKAGVASVPNALGPVKSWEDLQALAGHLGPDLVIQTAFGDSGTTTYFVSSREDLDKVLPKVAAEREVKVMKKIRCFQAAVEGCVTSAGTIVGPMMTEIVGFSELTPYKGGWAGNEVAPHAFTEAQRIAACKGTESFGDVLREEGWRGYFEIDWLVDLDTDALYLGEVNPRITGASPLTNLAAFAHADAPLFLFHLLEWSGIPFTMDVARLNARWAHPVHADPWGQLIIKHTDKEPVEVMKAPTSGSWSMAEDGSIAFQHMQTHRRTVDDENSAFFLRIAEAGDIVRYGDDVGVLVVRGRLMNDQRGLTERAKAWTAGVRGAFQTRPF
jgi:hypothetical protein